MEWHRVYRIVLPVPSAEPLVKKWILSLRSHTHTGNGISEGGRREGRERDALGEWRRKPCFGFGWLRIDGVKGCYKVCFSFLIACLCFLIPWNFAEERERMNRARKQLRYLVGIRLSGCDMMLTMTCSTHSRARQVSNHIGRPRYEPSWVQRLPISHIFVQQLLLEARASLVDISHHKDLAVRIYSPYRPN